jgi:type IV pilus assembly protein PilV
MYRTTIRFRSHGISLLEALIAALILSVGLIGLVRMQSKMVSASTDAQLRYTAVQLADEHLNLVRVDSANAACYTLPAAGACNSAAAAAHTTEWAARVSASLPGTVTRSVALNAATGQLSVSIGWTSRQATDPRLLNVVTDVRQ